MGWIIITIGVVVSLIFITVATLLAIKFTKAYKSVNIPPDLPFCINLLPEFTSGFSVGLENRNKKRKNGGTLVEFYPIDLMSREGEWDTPITAVQQLFIGKNRRVALPRGEFSSQREIVFYLPKDINHLSTRLLGTILGEVVMKTTNNISILDNVLEGVRQKDVAQASIMKDYAMGELSIMNLARAKEISKEMKDIIIAQLTQQAGGVKDVPKPR